jgi:hypothetical protein
MPDLWPDDFGKPDVVPPLVILKEQATGLGARTKQRVLGEVATVHTSTGFSHTFYLLAPFLDEYRYRLFSVSHDILMYPLTIDSGKLYRCQDQDEFMRALAGIFSDEKTRRVISALLAQSDAARH